MVDFLFHLCCWSVGLGPLVFSLLCNSVCLNMCVCDCVVLDAWRVEAGAVDLWSVTEHCYAVLLPVGSLGSCFLTAVCRLKFAWIYLNIWENNNIYAWICCCWNLQMNGVFPGFWKFGSVSVLTDGTETEPNYPKPKFLGSASSK